MPKLALLTGGFLCLALYGCTPADMESNKNMTENQKTTVVFATYASSQEELQHACFLAESIREFAGSLCEAPVWVYVPDNVETPLEDIKEMFAPLDVSVRTSHTPEPAAWFYYAGKTFAAGKAETEAESEASVLVWMDEDTIVLRDPTAFRLDPDCSFAYRPVMHNRSGTLYGQKPNRFWQRIYEVLEIAGEALFPMTTPADGQEINAYFNAGLLVVRPEKRTLRNWGRYFEKLYTDSALVAMCREKVDNRIFLHQTALVGAVLNHLDREELTELPAEYNYPLFFEQMFGANREFGSIEGIATLRYDVYFRNPDPEWQSKLSGPTDRIGWLGQRLSR